VIPEGPSACTLQERIEYALPAGPAGDVVRGGAAGALLDRMFEQRRRVADDLAAHVACRGGRTMMMAITGSDFEGARPHLLGRKA
jgi:hypothetical protein